MKCVFIFGAGASHHANAPLMNDFLDRAVTVFGKAENNQEAFQDVFNAIGELRTVHDKSDLDRYNVEVLFSAVEMGRILGRFGDRDETSIEKLHNSLITVIVETLEHSTQVPISMERIEAPTFYRQFVQDIVAPYWQATVHDLSFITFNYDVMLDLALAKLSRPFSYFVNDDPPKGHVPFSYLKLHGSLNWGTCPEVGCRRVVPIDLRKWATHAFTGQRGSFRFDFANKFSDARHCQTIVGPPVIVPPTWNKGEYHNVIARVWKQAAKVLAEAENIFIIGYSLPPTDTFFHYLFALGTDSPVRIKNIWVFNPDESVHERFDRLIGSGLRRRFKFFPNKFEKAIGRIKEELEAP